MISNPKPVSAAPAVANAVDSTVVSFAALMHRGIERLASLQKTTLDVASQQTADINAAMRKFVKVPAGLSGYSFLDLTGQAVEDWIGTQKKVLDLMVEQSAQTVETTEQLGSNATKSVTGLSGFVQTAAERAFEAQKVMLDFAAKQGQAASEVIQKQANVTGTLVAKTTQSLESGMTSLIDTNREFLETASQLTKVSGRN